MSLKFEIDSLDGLDDTAKSLYTKDGDKFRLSVEGLPQPEDNTSLKSALQKERKAAAEAAKLVKQYQELGLSADEISAIVEEKKKSDEDKAKKAGEFEKLKAQIVDKHTQELKSKDDELSGMSKTLEKFLIDAQATAAIAEAKGIPALLLPHVQRQMKVIKADTGEYKAIVIGADGVQRVDGKGEPMTVSALIAEMKSQVDTFGRAFEGSGASGSGTPPGSGSGAGGSNSGIKRRSDFKNEIERGKWVNEHGLEAYKALAD